jgi:hypothetical protein
VPNASIGGVNTQQLLSEQRISIDLFAITTGELHYYHFDFYYRPTGAPRLPQRRHEGGLTRPAL